MKRKGFALIYVLIIIIPLSFMGMSFLDINLTNFKMNANIINAQQSYYYAEAGLEHGICRAKELGFQSNYKLTYYIYFDDLSLNASSKYSGDRYVQIKISFGYINGKKICTIDSTGFFQGSMQNIKKEFNF
jgi:flagellar basal body-associated protein FliL